MRSYHLALRYLPGNALHDWDTSISLLAMRLEEGSDNPSGTAEGNNHTGSRGPPYNSWQENKTWYSLSKISPKYMGGSTNSQKAGRLKRLEAKIVKKPASYRDYVET